MKKYWSLILLTTILCISTSSMCFAGEGKISISEKEYTKIIKTYLNKDKIRNIKHGPGVYPKVIFKGMNIGYLEPKNEEINQSKSYISSLLDELRPVTTDNIKINEVNDLIISNLESMYSYLDRAHSEHIAAMSYDKDFLDKIAYLSFNQALTEESSANINLTDYNETLKEIKRAYKDIK